MYYKNNGNGAFVPAPNDVSLTMVMAAGGTESAGYVVIPFALNENVVPSDANRLNTKYAQAVTFQHGHSTASWPTPSWPASSKIEEWETSVIAPTQTQVKLIAQGVEFSGSSIIVGVTKQEVSFGSNKSITNSSSISMSVKAGLELSDELGFSAGFTGSYDSSLTLSVETETKVEVSYSSSTSLGNAYTVTPIFEATSSPNASWVPSQVASQTPWILTYRVT